MKNIFFAITEKNGGKGFSLIFLFVLISPILIALSISDYLPGSDDSWQSQAAYRISRGLGYTASLDDERFIIPSEKYNLSMNYNYLNSWPPGFSYLVAFFIKVGFKIEVILKFFIILTYLIGIVSWHLLSTKFIKNIFPLLFFSFFLIITSTMMIVSPTTLFVWALFPINIYLMFGIQSDKGYRKNLQKIVLLILIDSIFFLFRYLALSILIGSIIYLIYEFRVPIRRYFLPILIILSIGAISTFFYIKTSLLHYFLGDVFTLDYITPKLFVEALSILVLKPFFIDIVVSKLINVFGSQELLLPVQIITLTCIIWAFAFFSKNNNTHKKFKIISIFYILSNTLLLLSLQFSKTISDSNWSALLVHRYHWHLFPIILLNVFIIYDSIDHKYNKYFKSITLLMLSLILVFRNISIAEDINYKRRAFNNIKIEYKKDIQKLKSNFLDYGCIMFAQYPFTSILLSEDIMPVYRKFNIVEENKYYFSKPAILIITIPSANIPRSLNSEKYNYESLLKYIHENKFSVMYKPDYKLFWKIF